MALSKIIAEGVDLTDTFAFTGTVTGAGLSSPFGNTVAVTSEGGAVTTNLAQGLAKAWFTFNYATTVQDSFNIGSVTDEATGHCFGNFSSNMNNNDFAHPAMTGAYRTRFENPGPDATTSRTNTIETYNSSGSSADDSTVNCTVHGDLA